jgi:hypothetical protein
MTTSYPTFFSHSIGFKKLEMQKKMCVYNVYLDGFLDPRLEKGNDDNV